VVVLMANPPASRAGVSPVAQVGRDRQGMPADIDTAVAGAQPGAMGAQQPGQVRQAAVDNGIVAGQVSTKLLGQTTCVLLDQVIYQELLGLRWPTRPSMHQPAPSQPG
jgi:hypothetical protein